MNFIDAEVEKDGDGFVLHFGEARIRIDNKALEPYVGKTVICGVRPEDFHAEKQFFGTGNAIDAYVDLDEMMGSESYLYLNYAEQKLVTRVPARYAKKADEYIRLAIDPEKVHVFDKDTELAICQ